MEHTDRLMVIGTIAEDLRGILDAWTDKQDAELKQKMEQYIKQCREAGDEPIIIMKFD